MGHKTLRTSLIPGTSVSVQVDRRGGSSKPLDPLGKHEVAIEAMFVSGESLCDDTRCTPASSELPAFFR
jgi:hypothetical protein